MPPIRFSASKYSTYYSKLIAVILLFSKIMLSCSYCTEKGLVYIIITALSSRQPSLYTKCTKLNIYTLYCYRPSIISVIVTKERPLSSSGLYRLSGTIGQGVAKLYS